MAKQDITVTKVTPKIPVKNIMKVSPQELAKRLRTNITIVFDDGVERELSFREVIVNRYIWEVLTVFENPPVLSTFDITNGYTMGFYVSNTFHTAFKNILKYAIDNIMDPQGGTRHYLPALWKKMQEAFNAIYNDIVYQNLRYTSSLDINSFLDIQLHPDLVNAMRGVAAADYNNRDEVAGAIENAYKTLHNILTSPEYENNKIAQGYISKTMRADQLRQVLGPRGNITNLNEELYRKPIASSFTSGMYSIDELAMESQTGAKSLKVGTTAVSSSEFFARKLQLVMARVEKVVDGDCGQTSYIDWTVEAEDTSKDHPVKCHLPMLVGKYFYNPETNQEEVITLNHTHLIGKTIKLRVAYKCKWHDKRCICSKCFGQLAYNLPPHCHVGHYCATVMTQEMTQKALSFKHEISSANSLPVYINPLARGDFETKASNNTDVFLKKKHIINKIGGVKHLEHDNTKDFELFIKVAATSAKGLADINPNTDVKKFSPRSVSRLYHLWLIKVNRSTGEVTEIPVEIRKGNMHGSFTTEFLLHIQQVEYTIDAEENITIPLERWNMNLPIIMIPDVEFSYINFSKNVSKLFGAASGGSKRKTEADAEDDILSINTQEGFLYRLFTEVNSRLNVNICRFEVIVAAFSVNNYEAGDYSVAHGSDTASTRNIKTILTNGSAGGFYPYQEHMDTMLNPTSFDPSNPINHIMDVYLAPEETIKDYESRPIKG